ncbi:MAG: CoB--CoM heterodisulfide reductase iron-sulfur subunit A family protein [Deltaproteobacteria bacterium]|nr:CoB--CoM heterodisulfide reductase iron-sulfur subunit A family protein [Deltaproteobacteria bacterium]
MKIGVYICHCGINIAATVDIEKVTAFARTLPHVAIARNYQYMCSDPGQDWIKNDIKNLSIDRVVVAACSPRMHEPTYRNACRSAGLNPYFFEMANIREQCSWVHPNKEQGTEKAMDLIASAVAKVSLHEPLEENEVGVTPAVLVIGGGIAGIQASLDVANSGFEVYLVEKSPSPGGHLAQLNRTFPNLEETSATLLPKLEEVKNHSLIHLLTQSEVEGVEGFVGNFKVRIRHDPRYVNPEKCTCCKKCEDACPVRVPNEFNMGLDERPAIYLPFPDAIPRCYTIDSKNCLYLQKGECGKCREVCPEAAVQFEEVGMEFEAKVGTIIVATGYDSFDPRLKPELGYGVYKNVITGLEFERLISPDGPTQGKLQFNGKEPKSIVFIQCVGSRDKTVNNEYCSRICCMFTAKQAHLVKDKIPDARVTICYIDVRAFGKGYEQFYETVQKKGIFYRKGVPSEIYQKNGKLIVKAEDELLGEPYEEEADLVVLATGLTQRKDAGSLRGLLKLSLSPDRFYLEAHPKLRPLDTATDGIFLAGTCQGPKDISDTLSQAHGTASRATIPLFAGRVRIEPITAYVDVLMCAGCGLCEQVCEYRALKIDPYRKVMTVNEALCKGCGACNATCPSSAISLRHFKTEQIMAQLREVC